MKESNNSIVFVLDRPQQIGTPKAISKGLHLSQFPEVERVREESAVGAGSELVESNVAAIVAT